VVGNRTAGPGQTRKNSRQFGRVSPLFKKLEEIPAGTKRKKHQKTRQQNQTKDRQNLSSRAGYQGRQIYRQRSKREKEKKEHAQDLLPVRQSKGERRKETKACAPGGERKNFSRNNKANGIGDVWAPEGPGASCIWGPNKQHVNNKCRDTTEKIELQPTTRRQNVTSNRGTKTQTNRGKVSGVVLGWYC